MSPVNPLKNFGDEKTIAAIEAEGAERSKAIRKEESERKDAIQREGVQRKRDSDR